MACRIIEYDGPVYHALWDCGCRVTDKPELCKQHTASEATAKAMRAELNHRDKLAKEGKEALHRHLEALILINRKPPEPDDDPGFGTIV